MSPIRRCHKKSRLGCDQCRQRRVKCDEQLPACTSCTQRGKECHYVRADALRRRNTTNQAPSFSLPQTQAATAELSASPSIRLVLSSAFGLTPTRLRELELMYCWSAKTYKSFSSDFGTALREHVAREAFQFEFLMEGLLALTSLHIAHETKDRGTAIRHVSAALHYQEKAIVGLRKNLSTLSQSNCNAVFGAATLVMINAIVSPFLSNTCIAQPRSSPAALLMLVDLVKGTRCVKQVSHDWLKQGPYACLFQPTYMYPPLSLCVPVAHLHELAERELCAKTRLSYKHAIDELACAARSTKTVFPWLTVLQHEFLERLRDEDAVALAIVMCWAVQLEQLHDVWWARYCGQQLVEDLATMLECSGPEFEVITLWCRGRVETSTMNAT